MRRFCKNLGRSFAVAQDDERTPVILRRSRRISLGNAKGSSTVEFMVALPILSLLLLLAWDFNERIGNKQDLAIASRNLSAQNLAGDAAASLRGDFKDAEQADASSVKTSVAKIYSSKDIDYQQSNYGDRLKKDLPVVRGNSLVSYSTVSSAEGHVAHIGNKLLHFIKVDFAIGDNRLFIEDRAKLYQVDFASTKLSRMQESIKLFSGLVAESEGSDDSAWKWLANDDVRSAYVRAANGYHTNSYHWHSLLGFALGMFGDQKHWGQPYARESRMSLGMDSSGGFQTECMMHFMGASDCIDVNWLALLIRMGYQVVGLAKIIPLIGQGLQAGGVAAQAATTVAMQVVSDQVSRFITDTVNEQTKNFTSQSIEETPFYKNVQDIEKELTESSVKNVKEQLKGKL